MPLPSDLLRLNQAISRLGYCSRRKADELILAGQVMVNDKKVLEFNTKVNVRTDKISINKNILESKPCTYILMNKPKDVITTCHDEKNRKSIVDLLPNDLKNLKPVGRLDRNSVGLIILTDDGYLANLITHPSRHIPKTYWVKINGHIKANELKALANGIELSDGLTSPAQVGLIEYSKLYSVIEITLTEGKNRQIRRMFEALGYDVKSLNRIRIGNLTIKNLKPGQFRYLTKSEINELVGH